MAGHRRRSVCQYGALLQTSYGVAMSSNQGSAVSTPRRRPRRASTYFLIGVLAACAIGGWYLWQRGLTTRTVCVATADLPAYDQITPADVRKAELPSDEIPSQAVADPSELVGRYTLAAARRYRPIDLAELGPRLPSGTLAQQLVVGLPVSISEIAGGAVAPGDRVDILLSSTAASSPRNGVLRRVLVLDVKSGGNQPGQFVIVCAIPEMDEDTLLAAGGTARIFIARVPPGISPRILRSGARLGGGADGAGTGDAPSSGGRPRQ